MYSYDERLRAVELYIRLGRRARATICELGYPTAKALRGWHREYELKRDLPRRYTARPPKFTDAQKQVALQHYVGHGYSISGTVQTLGFPCRGTLAAWVHEAFPNLTVTVGTRGRNCGPSSDVMKRAAITELYTRVESAQAVAEKFGVSRPTLYSWKNSLLGPEAPTTMKRKKPILATLSAECSELEHQFEKLQRAVCALQIEHDLLQKASELVKKEFGGDLQSLSNREKTTLIVALKNLHKVPQLLIRLGLARSSYFYHCARIAGEDKYVSVRQRMVGLFETNHRCYGYRRLRASLAQQSIAISEKVVRRLMKQEALIIPKARRRRYNSYLGEISPAPENLINRDFHAAAPNEKWLTDITEFRIRAGKVYLSPVIDCFDGLAISWAIGTRPDAGLVNTMLDAAIGTITDTNEQPIVHTDRGAHYRWPGWLKRVDAAKLIRSMSRKASSEDNAACEGFFGRLKTEFFYPRNWQNVSVGQFIQELDDYIRWYNESRIKMSLGGRSSVDYRKSLGLAT